MPLPPKISHAPHGYILVLALVFLGIFFTVGTAYLSSVTTSVRSQRYDVASAQALSLAEAGIDEAVSKLNADASYTGETNTALGAGTFTVTVTSLGGSAKKVVATGSVPSSANPVASKTVRANIGIDSNIISFRYGVQTGAGGFKMDGGSTLNGSIYANGSIVATNGVHITGSAAAANPPALTTDQANDQPSTIPSCTTSTCISFASTTAAQDFAQSFKISSDTSLNNIQLYIKKVSTPSDATVRIVNDSGGSPGTDVLMTGTLSAALVTTSFGWVSVPLPVTPILEPTETYWVVLDASANTSKYYVLGANANGYANGTAKLGRYGVSWSNTSPSGLDGYFRLYLGGGTSLIGGDSNSGGVQIGTTGSDDAWAHTVQGATVSGALYCQTGTVNNKSCDTSQSDPPPQPMPLSDGNIQDWKDEAAAGGTITGDYTVNSAGATLGPKKITGNLLVNGGGTLTQSGTLWVVGSVTVTGGARVKLASSYGASDGVLVSDGPVTISGGGAFAGSGISGSYPFLITTSICPAEAGCAGVDAISLIGGAGTVALIAQDGNVLLNGGSSLKAVTGKQITMTGGATLTYDSGLVNANFTSGPGGSWIFVPGTYSIAP